jgi:alpha-L-fucosidase 2
MDANFGTTAGIAEMLIQSHAGVLQLLPALPKDWPAGKVTGLKARGNLTADMEWSNGTLKTAVIHSANEGNIKIKYKDQLRSVSFKKGETRTLKF